MIALKLPIVFEVHSVFSGVTLFHSKTVKTLQSSRDTAFIKCCQVCSLLNVKPGAIMSLLLDISSNVAISANFLKE